MSVLKITSFKRISKMEQKDEIRPFLINKDSVIMNVLLYSEIQNASIDSFEKWVRSQHKSKVNFMKLVQQKSIIPTIKTVLEKKHRKTYVVSTKTLTTELEAFIKANQSKQLTDILLDLKFILFVDKIEQVQPNNFWIKDICLISSQIQDIQTYLQAEILKLDRTQYEEVSSLNSEDQSAFEEQFIKKWNPISLPKSSPKKQENQGEIVFNDTPGVGSYELSVENKFQGSKSGTFSKQKKQRQ